MTTEREPLCDLLAQFAAYTDPDHPKRAVWVTRGQPIPAWPDMGRMYTFRAGYLWASADQAERLKANETEETLAEILDYLEPKSAIRSQPASWWPVIQARDADGCVVFEAITSWARAGEAMRHAARYGRLHVLTMFEVLQRRRQLIAQEEGHAQGIKGRPGREQAQARVSRQPTRGLRHAEQGQADAWQQADQERAAEGGD